VGPEFELDFDVFLDVGVGFFELRYLTIVKAPPAGSGMMFVGG
jgi:hypothetical protein